MALFPHTLLTTAYFPPVSWFFALAQSTRVEIEACESYQKQSYRNRCRIYSAAGPEALVVPVVHARGAKIPIRDVRIDYSEPWVRLHERAMTAAYNHSAFFEYYRDDLFRILEGREAFLFDLNWKLTEKLIEFCGLRISPVPTADFLPPDSDPAVTDFAAGFDDAIKSVAVESALAALNGSEVYSGVDTDLDQISKQNTFSVGLLAG